MTRADIISFIGVAFIIDIFRVMLATVCVWVLWNDGLRQIWDLPLMSKPTAVLIVFVLQVIWSLLFPRRSLNLN